jgi:hypothetical protein
MKGARFVRRTWRRTSDYICEANGFPPGFRVVLVDEQGDAKRSNVVVRSGAFGAYPGTMSVGDFLEQILVNHIRDAGRVAYRGIELRSNLGKVIDPTLSLRRVRGMSGANGQYSVEYEHDEDTIQEIQDQIAEAVENVKSNQIFEQQPNLDDLVVKALINCIFDQFADDIDLIDYGLVFFQRKLALARARGSY